MLKLLRQLQHRIERIEMSDSNVKALEEKIWIFEQQLKDEKAPSNATLEASKSRQHDIVEKMEANDLECESLRVRLYHSTANFAKFKEQTIRKAALQERATRMQAQLLLLQARSQITPYSDILSKCNIPVQLELMHTCFIPTDTSR
jgi:hypothetical protein